MIKNYFLVAFRHLKRQPSYALLNILGLTLGIGSSLLILLYVSNELSYDNYHENKDRIYRVSSDIREPDNAFRWASSQLPLGRTLATEFSEVESFVRFNGVGQVKFNKGDQVFFEDKVFIVDSTVFDIFSYDIIAGDPDNILDNPNSIAISQSMASKIFGTSDPLGQVLETETRKYQVTGVYKDVPQNSHIRPNALIAMSSIPDLNNAQNWGGFNIYTYILLTPQANPKEVEAKLEGIIDKYVAVIFDQFNIEIKYELTAVPDIHLYSDFQGEPEPLGDISYIYVFSAIALFLIGIACINYMNLSTARSMKRSLEVGIRKVMGAHRNSLISQFLSESILITLISMLIALVLVVIMVPALNAMLNTNMMVYHLLSPQLIFIILGIILLTSLLSGSYPAFYLSAFRPAVVLKGRSTKKSGNSFLRKFLVGLQFAISIFMLVGTLVIYNQMKFLEEKDLGFDKDSILRIGLNNRSQLDKWPVFRSKLLQNSNIEAVASTNSSPGQGYGKNVMSVETREGVMEDFGIDLFAVDYDYFPTLNIDIINGRNFSKEYITDTAAAVIVNEAMVQRLGWDNPIGKKFQFPQDSVHIYKVVGVAKNYHHRSLYNPIEAILFLPRFNNNTALIKTSGNTQEAVRSINTIWDEIFPGIPLEYSFLDEEFMEQYETDRLRGRLFLTFAAMMILIACLGLLGLASFIAEQRSKEISIRKVLGAETRGLVALLVKDFVILVLIGAVPAFAIGYYAMNEWLQNFEFHINISAIHFVVVLLIILLITIVTTGYHALKAASSNPADNLKYE